MVVVSSCNLSHKRHFVILAVLFSLNSTLIAQDASTPKWIHCPERSLSKYQLLASANLDEVAKSAHLKIASDFARASVSINNVKVLTVEPYCQLQSIDVTQWLRSGENRWTVDVERVEGPSAVAIECVVETASGQRLKLHTDESWSYRIGSENLSRVEALGNVRPEIWGAGRRAITLSPVENYEQWRQSAGGDAKVAQPKFWTAPGFEVTLLRTASESEGSWISMTFDSKGRAVISREDSGLLRMTINDAHTSVESVTPIDVDLKECRGLAFDGDELYANANNSKGLFRLQIDEAGHTTNKRLIREFPGSVGHGRNDITIHDGWLYEIHGDSVDLPKESVTDLTSPFRHWPGDTSRHEGHLLRMHLKTGEWEVLCGGLRNPYGIAAHPSGEIFTFDADNEYDMGTPWYRPTRVVALYPGGDVGYRTAGKQLPPRFHDQPENLPPVLTIGRSSPTAVFCDPKLDFPDPYRRALFLLDWTYGRVIAVHLSPHGAGWRAESELFLQGRPLNVTDIARGPDGAMYLITGGRKTQSSLYRVATKASATNAETSSTRVHTHERDVERYSQGKLAVRKRLESISRQRDSNHSAMVIENLTCDDPVLRHAARIALERLATESWPKSYVGSENDRQWLYWQLAAMQAQVVKSAERGGDAEATLDRWLAIEPGSFGLSQRFVWLRVIELYLRANSENVQDKRSSVIKKLLDNWPSAGLHVAPEGSSVELRQRMALVLGQLESVESIESITRDLIQSAKQEDQLAGLLSLRHLKHGWSTAARRGQWRAFRETEHMIGGQGLPTFVDAIRSDSLNSLRENERVSLADLIEAKSQEVFELAPSRSVVRKWQIEDLKEIAGLSPVDGDRTRGARIYRDAYCVRCHRVGRLGKSIGPDLTFAGRRFNSKDLLEAILVPSRSVAENFRMDVVVMESGVVHTGTILVEGDYRSEKLKIQTDPLRSQSIVEVDKREIAEHRQLERSPMPDGLLDLFDREEIRDLIAYLQNPIEAGVP